VFDERNADVRVVADAATMDDRIYQRKRAQNRFLSITDTIAPRTQGLRRVKERRKTRHRRSSDFQKRCAGDVPKSCKRTGSASLPALPVRKVWRAAEFQQDCKSIRTSRGYTAFTVARRIPRYSAYPGLPTRRSGRGRRGVRIGAMDLGASLSLVTSTFCSRRSW